ncbi:hypothetical protein IIA79_07030 [bacterium]|nr:hypothetical protein [bacterium]
MWTGHYEDLFLISPSGDSGTLEALTNTADIFESHPTWSPDATRLAYQKAYRADPEVPGLLYEIWIHDFTTGESARVDLGGPFSNSDLALVTLNWARTQDKIAFAGITSGYYDIWVVDLADPANPVQLTNDPSEDFVFPSWSPDDSEIVYQKGGRLSSDYSEIWKMNADGSGKTLLVKPSKGLYKATFPDWKR